MLSVVLLSCLLSSTIAQYQYSPQGGQGGPPQQAYQPLPQQVPVHKPASVHYVNIGAQLQGDYKFGYDTGRGNDGQSFREETRLPDGTVQGAYGYVDGAGRQRIVKYTAGKDGFKAEGDVGPDGVPQGRSPGPAPQPAQNPHPQQPAYAQPAPQQYAPPPQPAPQQYAPRPAPQSYAPRPAPVHQGAYNPNAYGEPNNEINGPPAPIDTSLLAYNIGASPNTRG